MLKKFLRIPLLLRAMIIGPAVGLWTLFCSVICVAMVSVGLPQRIYMTWISALWARMALWMSFVRVEISGEEHIPDQRGFLFVFNHTSHYDILVLFAHSPRYFFFGAKSELFSIPLFGAAMKSVGILPIERKNREKVMAIYREAEARVAKGDSFALAPEGTRQPGHGTLGEFKTGPFYFAINAKMPIVPVIMRGCEEIMPKKSLWINPKHFILTVKLQFLEPIETTGMTEDHVNELKQRVREKMMQALHSSTSNY